MNKYVLHNTVAAGDNNAGSKAGRDAVEIAEKLGYQFVALYKAQGIHTSIMNVIEGYLNTRKLCRKLHSGDIVFLQYPINRQLMKHVYRLLKRKGTRIITLIHDIDYLRDVPLRGKGVDEMRKLELSLLQNTDYLICHNEFMIERLKQEGLDVQYVSLDLFDYLYDGASATNTHDDTVVVAGNLAPQKAGYLYKLREPEFSLALYGSNLGIIENPRVDYRGSYPPDELISHMEGAYGLVWDGDDTSSCTGPYGKYLRLNNPHKASLYLAAGLPIIVWKQSALYPFIKQNDVGIGVESLDEINSLALKSESSRMAENVRALQEKVRTGGFLTRALQHIEKDIANA